MVLPTDAAWAVAVFAHNEERSIAACLESLHAAADGHCFDAFILINGCADATEAIVNDHARGDPAVHPVVIPVGDKANAWNQYVHQVAPGAEIHAFVDGDVRVRPAGFRRLQEALAAHPRANAACGIPMSGRSQHHLAEQILGGKGFHGSLYALRGRTVAALKELRLRLPIGLIGDDSLLGWLLQRDLDPLRTADPSRIVAAADAGFDFDSLSPWRPHAWQVYHRRLGRNSLRQMQLDLLMPMLREQGLSALPTDVAELYTSEQLALLKPRRSPITCYFDILAISKIKAKVIAREYQTH